MLPGISPACPAPRRDGALAAEPDVLAEVPLALREVVVAVDPLLLLHGRADPVGELAHHPVHHLLAVEQGESLRPAELGDVAVELGRALDQVGEVGVRQRDPPRLHRRLGDLDVRLGDLVADAPAARVQEQPDRVRLVEADLDEVVAAAQRAELQLPVAGVRRRVEAGLGCQRLELGDARLGGRDDLAVVGAGRGRHGPLDLLAQGPAVGRQVGRRELRAHGDHAAADVDADGGRHHGAERRDHRPDGGAEAQVGVGHQREVREYERHRRRRPGLLRGLLLEQARPAEQPGSDLLHGPLGPLWGGGVVVRGGRTHSDPAVSVDARDAPRPSWARGVG